MTNLINLRKGLVFVLLTITALVSCGAQPKETNETKVMNFKTCAISLKMTLPKGWIYDTNTSNYNYTQNSGFFPSGKVTTWATVSNIPIGGNGFSIFFDNPCYIGEKDVNTLPGTKKTRVKCGDNYVYFSDSPKEGAVYIDRKVIWPFKIYRWPENGVTPEIVSMFGSVHIK